DPGRAARGPGYPPETTITETTSWSATARLANRERPYPHRAAASELDGDAFRATPGDSAGGAGNDGGAARQPGKFRPQRWLESGLAAAGAGRGRLETHPTDLRYGYGFLYENHGPCVHRQGRVPTRPQRPPLNTAPTPAPAGGNTPWARRPW